MPFGAIFLLWNAFFAMQIFVFRSNADIAESTEGVPEWIGY